MTNKTFAKRFNIPSSVANDFFVILLVDKNGVTRIISKNKKGEFTSKKTRLNYSFSAN